MSSFPGLPGPVSFFFVLGTQNAQDSSGPHDYMTLVLLINLHLDDASGRALRSARWELAGSGVSGK